MIILSLVVVIYLRKKNCESDNVTCIHVYIHTCTSCTRNNIYFTFRIYATCSSEETMYCAALNCSVRSKQGYSLYKFPEKDEQRRKIWIQNLGRGDYYEPSTLARICVKHFDGNQFIVDPSVAASIGYEWKKLTLRNDAIPTVFDHTCTDYPEIKERKGSPVRKRTRKKLKRKLSSKSRPNILRKEVS